jgi:hypothetical protein
LPAGVVNGPHDVHATAFYSITEDGVVLASFGELVEVSSERKSSHAAPDSDEEREARREELRGKGLLPGVVKLSRGQTDELALFRWHREGTRRDVVLVMYSALGDALDKYLLGGACATKLETTARPGGASQILYETVTLTCEDIQRVGP